MARVIEGGRVEKEIAVHGEFLENASNKAALFEFVAVLEWEGGPKDLKVMVDHEGDDG